jgi:hypothetical protein
MRAPWTLRWALAWAAIRHEFISISVDYHTEARYVFEVRPQAVRRWLARGKSMRAKLSEEREAERTRVAMDMLTIFEDHAPHMTDKAMLDAIHERLHSMLIQKGEDDD